MLTVQLIGELSLCTWGLNYGTCDSHCQVCVWYQRQFGLLLVLCRLSQQSAGVPLAQTCFDDCTCCHTEISTLTPGQPVLALTEQRQVSGRLEYQFWSHWNDSTWKQVSGRLEYLSWSHWNDSTRRQVSGRPEISPEVTGMTPPGDSSMGKSGNQPSFCSSSGRCLSHKATRAVTVWEAMNKLSNNLEMQFSMSCHEITIPTGWVLTLDILYHTMPHTHAGLRWTMCIACSAWRTWEFCFSSYISSKKNSWMFKPEFGHFLFNPYRKGFWSLKYSPLTPGCWELITNNYYCINHQQLLLY